MSKIYFAIVLITIFISSFFSCATEKKFDECEQKFVGSYFFLQVNKEKYFDKHRNIEINMPDSARHYMSCMMQIKPKHFRNYYWKSKMHILLEEYDSVVQVMEGIDFSLENHEKYVADTYTGLGYEFLQNIDKANKQYTNAQVLLKEFEPKEPIYEALSSYLLNNNAVELKEGLIDVVEQAHKKEPNDSLKAMYLREIDNIPFNQGRESILKHISIGNNDLFW